MLAFLFLAFSDGLDLQLDLQLATPLAKVLVKMSEQPLDAQSAYALEVALDALSARTSGKELANMFRLPECIN